LNNYYQPKPKVFLVGGPDVDARLDLMRGLQEKFDLVALGTNSNLANVFQENGFKYIFYPLKRHVAPIDDILATYHLLKIFQKNKPTIVHTFDTKPCIFARIAARLAGVPVIVGTIPGLGSLYRNTGFKYSILRIFYEPLQKIASYFSNLSIFQNENDRDKFISLGIVPEGKAKIIPGSGVHSDIFDISRFTEYDRNQIRKELNISPDNFVITMITRLTKSKGVLEFCDAANGMRNDGKFAFLLVGPVDKESVDLLSEKDIQYVRESVLWVGKRNDIDHILAASDLFVFPTSYGEGVPRVLLEATSMGLPVIATDLPGCKAVIDGGINGLLIPPHSSEYLVQAIRTLKESRGLRQKFGGKSRNNAVNIFDIKHIVKITEEVYFKLLEATYCD